jgi:hypothetical protein
MRYYSPSADENGGHTSIVRPAQCRIRAINATLDRSELLLPEPACGCDSHIDKTCTADCIVGDVNVPVKVCGVYG